ncbi:MAG: choice-of-anchor P family protein, partial [Pyrinomonadaceae bacterium]
SSFGVTSGPNSVTVDHVNAGSGLQSFTVVSSSNAVVNIPAFMPGTFNPVTATFTVIDPSQPVDFTLRAASLYHSIFIRVRCTTALNTFSGRAIAVNATIAGINATLVDTGPLPASGGFITRSLVSANVLGGALTTGLLTATTQGAGDQSRSQATTETLTLLVGGNIITSDIVAESSQCTCTVSGPICEGSILANLRINGVSIAITGQPNQVVNLVGGGTIVINEQIRTGAGNTAAITANGLHIVIPGVADVIISSAYSDIVCGT